MDIIQQLVKLIKINTKISSLHASDEILKEIMNEAMTLTGTAAAFILQVSQSREAVCLERYQSDKRESGINWSSSSALEAHEAQRMVYSTRALEGSAAPSIIAGSIQTLISAPLSAENSGTLILQLVGRDTTSIDPQMISLLNLFVSQVQVTTSKTKLEDLSVRNAALAATGELAAQVAHDIRSPLAALDTALTDLSELPESKRALIKSAVGRIQEIANNLIERHRADGPDKKTGGAPAVQLLRSLVEPLISEKRLQFREQAGMAIDCDLGSSSDALFARVVPADFNRDLSNLINNAVEAVGTKGRVSIALAAAEGQVIVTVRDNGRGIPPELLARLGRLGETHGKPEGLGLGLYRAKKDAAAWGGTLEIKSIAGKGTTVEFRLPLATPPGDGPDAVLVDDDPLVTMTWSLAAKAKGLTLAAFGAPDEFLSRVDEFPKDTPIYLDCDLGGGPQGDQIAQGLHARGFSNLFLSTGRTPDSFPPMPWIKSIIGKEPPWIE
jgi:signal transduction histidine kinase